MYELRWYRVYISVLILRMLFYMEVLNMKQLANKYDHREVESNKYDNWISKGYFTAGDLTKKPYCIVSTLIIL